MGRYIEAYLKNLESKRTYAGVIPNVEKLPLVDIHAWLLNTTLNEECSREDVIVHRSLLALCEACIAYEDALATTRDDCKAKGLTTLYEVFSQLEETFAEGVIQ